jgi:hypothetical protein
VTHVRGSGGRVTQIIAGDDIRSAHNCAAAGARSAQIAAKMGIALPVFPVRGQMIALANVVADPSRDLGRRRPRLPRAARNGLVFVSARWSTSAFAGGRQGRGRIAPVDGGAAGATAIGGDDAVQWAGLRPAPEA